MLVNITNYSLVAFQFIFNEEKEYHYNCRVIEKKKAANTLVDIVLS